MASFQDKKGWKTQGKRENKNCCFVLFRSYPMHNRKFRKNRKKFNNTILASFQAKIDFENAEKERI